MSDRRIIIEYNDGDFSVRVDPPQPGEDLDRVGLTLKVARGWASGLRLTHRWPIEDRSGDGA